MTTKAHPVNVSPPLVTITLDTEIEGWRYHGDGEPAGPGRTIADAIVTQAADRLVEQLRDAVSAAAIAKADEQITSQVHALVASVLAEPFHIRNAWGGGGQTTTIRQRISEVVADQLKPQQDSYNAPKSVISEVIDKQVKAALTNELSAVVRAARDKVVSSVHESAAELIAKAVQAGLR